MYSKKHLVLTTLIAVLTTFLFCGMLFLSLFLQGKIGFLNAEDWTLLRARNLIESVYVNELTEEQKTRMTDMAIEGMMYGLGDQYSMYLNAEELVSYEETREEVYKGIGVSVNFDATTGTMTVVSPYNGSPAQKAGIVPGDVVVQVGDMQVSAETYNSVLEYIQKGQDDDIRMVILRGGEELSFVVHREEIKRESVAYKMLPDSVGYIRISEFIHSSKEDFSTAISSLKEQGMSALVIDLRNNPGGYADSVIQMTDELLPKGVIAYSENKKGDRQYYNSDDNALDLPMAVLINGGTASASELMAGSLQAHGLATVIGEKSYGKAVGQSVYPLTDTTAIYITDSRYFTPKGKCIDGIGIEPDVKVTLDETLIGKITMLEPQEDPQLSKALEILKDKQ